MLLQLVIQNAWNIKLSQRPTKASFNRRSSGTTTAFLSLYGIQETLTSVLHISLSFTSLLNVVVFSSGKNTLNHANILPRQRHANVPVVAA